MATGTEPRWTVRTADAMTEFFQNAGLSVGWNHTYAGGHITRSNGDAKSTRQAVQIEINRDLYMEGAGPA